MLNIDNKTKIGFGIIVLALLLIFGFAYFVKNNPTKNYDNISNEALRTLSAGSRQDYEDDLKKLEEQEKNPPQDPEERYGMYYNLAKTRYALGKNRDAIRTLDKIVNETADYARPARVWYLYAQIYNESGDLDQALTSIKKAADADPMKVDYWLTYVGITQQKDPNADLTGIYNEALQKTGDAVEVVRAYARYLEYKGQKDEAIKQWQKAIEVDPEGRAEYEQNIQRLQAPAQ